MASRYMFIIQFHHVSYNVSMHFPCEKSWLEGLTGQVVQGFHAPVVDLPDPRRYTRKSAGHPHCFHALSGTFLIMFNDFPIIFR